MSKIKNGGLDQYGTAGPFEQQQFGTAGVERVNSTSASKRQTKNIKPTFINHLTMQTDRMRM